MIDDVFRNLLRQVAEADMAMASHNERIMHLATRRRQAIANMVDLARKTGEKAPQAFVAAKLGVTQQAVSKALTKR